MKIRERQKIQEKNKRGIKFLFLSGKTNFGFKGKKYLLALLHEHLRLLLDLVECGELLAEGVGFDLLLLLEGGHLNGSLESDDLTFSGLWTW